MITDLNGFLLDFRTNFFQGARVINKVQTDYFVKLEENYKVIYNR